MTAPKQKLPLAPDARALHAQVTFIIYMAALLSFVGWFVFSVYVGIGFIALPIDCINAFRFRPKPLAFSELQKQRKTLRDKAKDLITLATDLATDGR